MTHREYALATNFTGCLVHTCGLESYDAIDDYEQQWYPRLVRDSRRWYFECSQPALELRPGATGRYVLRVRRAADDPGPVRFRWRS